MKAAAGAELDRVGMEGEAAIDLWDRLLAAGKTKKNVLWFSIRTRARGGGAGSQHVWRVMPRWVAFRVLCHFRLWWLEVGCKTDAPAAHRQQRRPNNGGELLISFSESGCGYQ